jgi:hypothetical protein
LDVASGFVVGKCYKRHWAAEFLDFLKQIDGRVPEGLDVHIGREQGPTLFARRKRTGLCAHVENLGAGLRPPMSARGVDDSRKRSIRMTLSLAFLAPDIVKTVVDGKLPRGFGVSRLIDLPMDWAVQRQVLGFAPSRIG